MVRVVDRTRPTPFDGYLWLSVTIGAFLAFTYVACTIWDGLFPSASMREFWQAVLPGFEWWSWGSFFLGLAESFAYGFWFALLLPLIRWALPSPEPARRREVVAW